MGVTTGHPHGLRLSLNAVKKPTGNAPATVMYLIQKSYADRDIVDGIIERLQDAHYEHLRTYGANVVSASVKDENSKNLRSIAIGDYGSWENAARFVYEDPYTRAGMFDAITIDRVDLYKLDGSFERAPAWFYDTITQNQTGSAEK